MPKWDRTKGAPEPIHLLNRVHESESGEPLVDIREFAPLVRLQRPAVIPYVRKRVAEMCRKASEQLPENHFLSLMEGWRPIERQQRIYDFMWSSALEAFPDRTRAALRRTVCRWVAPTDQKAPPGHCTGAAVDVLLVNENNESIDVTSPYDRFHGAPTYTLGLSETAAKNRSILVDTMLGIGFSNCRDEWWHYSFGDSGWAVRTGATECIYGLARLDPALYADLEALHIESQRDRVNPFLPPA